MGVSATARRVLQRALIAAGLWPTVRHSRRLLRAPLRRLRDALLLQLTRAGLYDASLFLPHSGSPVTLLRDDEERAKSAKTASEMLRVLDRLVLNGSSQAEESLARIRQFRLPRDVARHVARLDATLAAIRSLPGLDSILSDPAQLAAFECRDGIQFFSNKSSQKLIVVFTTVYNNFGVSNAILYALLRRYGVSILLLKDPTVCAYGCGVRGLGSDPEQLATAIARLAADAGCTEIYATGYSSGGYPSLLFSSLAECRGYLGFSVQTGAGYYGDPLPRQRVFSDAQHFWVTTKVAPRFHVGLRSVFEKRRDGCRRVLVVGERNEIDMAHAQDVSHCPGFEVLVLDGCGHDTVAAAIERGLMDGLLKQLLRG